MLYKMQCTVGTVFPKEQITDNFSKRVVWVKTQDQYNNDVEFQFVNANTSLLDDLKEGDAVEVTFAVGGRINTKGENERLFNTITGTAITKI